MDDLTPPLSCFFGLGASARLTFDVFRLSCVAKDRQPHGVAG